MARLAAILTVAVVLGAVTTTGCGKPEVPSTPALTAGQVVYSVVDGWDEVEKHWQLYGKDKQPCVDGWLSPVPKLYREGMAQAQYQRIAVPVIMAPPACTTDREPGETILRFQVTLPKEPTQFKFGVFLLNTGAASDGVQFQVKVDEDTLFAKQTNSYEAEVQTVDLREYAGETVTVEMITDSGRAKQISADWALWLDPKIVIAE